MASQLDAAQRQAYAAEPRHTLGPDFLGKITSVGCKMSCRYVATLPAGQPAGGRLGKYARFGYSSEIEMKRILKRRDFSRWQAGEKLPDAALCKAVQEMGNGLIDAELGGFLYKKRIARPGGGKSGGYRTVLSARIGSRYMFLHGFQKSDRANITQDEKRALQFAGKVFLELSPEALSKALQAGVLLEVHCEQDHRIST